MMTIKQQSIGAGKIELLVTLTTAKYEKFLRGRALELAENMNIPGFRFGKAPYEIIKNQIGEIQLLQESLNEIIKGTYVEVVEKQKIRPALPPKIDVQKMAPGNPLEYKIEVVVLPEVTLPDLTKIKVSMRKVEVTDKQADEALQHLRKMRASESLKKEPAAIGDKIELDILITVNGDDTQGERIKNQSLILGETKLIDGFAENILGLSTDEERSFKQKFPPKYQQKSYAGQKVNVKVKVNSVWQVNLPELNDEFAQAVNPQFKKLVDLKEQLFKNIKAEQTERENQRQEQEMLEKLIDQSKFDSIAPELLEDVTSRMVQEMRYVLEQSGGVWKDYLKTIKKSEDDLKKGFEDESDKRIKIDAIIAQIVDQEGIDVSDQEIHENIQQFLRQFSSVKEAKKQINFKQLQASVRGRLLSQKVIKWLKSTINQND